MKRIEIKKTGFSVGLFYFLSFFLYYAALFDTSLFAGKFAEVVKFCAANFTILVHYD